jgi:hypothetical protein
MKLKSFAVAAVFAFGIAAGAHASDLENRGFEAGDLTSWSATPGVWTDGFDSHPFVQVVTDADDAFGGFAPLGQHYDPAEGAYFAQLTAGADPDILDRYTLLSQAFDVTEDSFVTGSAAFLAFDDAGHDDDAYVRLYQQGHSGLTLVEELFASHISQTGVGDYGHTDWTGFTSQQLGVGTYVLEAGVRNMGDFDATPYYSSQLLVDGFAVTSASSTGAIPEPTTWALVLVGFGVAGTMLRRSRATAMGD